MIDHIYVCGFFFDGSFMLLSTYSLVVAFEPIIADELKEQNSKMNKST